MQTTTATKIAANFRAAMMALDLPTPRTWAIVVEIGMVAGLPFA